MAVVTENAQHEFAPQKNKPPSEDEKRYFSVFCFLFWFYWLCFECCFFGKIKEDENCAWEFDESFDEAWWR